jgi:hypothetical protein
MFDKEFLTKVAEDVIAKEEDRSHLEETGSNLIHYDFDILKVEDATLNSGRTGDIYKFSFEYQLSFLDEAHLKQKENEVRIFRRAVRLNPSGKVTGVGDRVEVLD